MKEKYAPLFEPIDLKHGGRLANRFAMCPMVVFAADPATGRPTVEDISTLNGAVNLQICF